MDSRLYASPRRDRLLDDVSVEEMEQKLGTKVRVLPVDGGAFCDAIFPWEE